MSPAFQVRPVFPVRILPPTASLQLLPAAPCYRLLIVAGFKSGQGASNTWAWICQNAQVLWLKQEGIHVIDRVANLLGIIALLSWSHVVISKQRGLSQYLKSIHPTWVSGAQWMCQCHYLCLASKLSRLLSLELLQIPAESDTGQNCHSWLWLVSLICVFDDMEESLRRGGIHTACLWESTCRVGGRLFAVVGPLPTSPCQSISFTMITHNWVWVGFEMGGALYESIFEQFCWQVVGWSTLSD